MKYVILASLLLTGCATRVTQPIIIKSTPTYTIGQTHTDKFLIWAVSPTEAQKAANEELLCEDQPCFIEPGGVVLFVERPVTPK